MASVVLRPNALASAGANWSVVGAANYPTALADDSDTTYALHANVAATDELVVDLATLALPALAQIRSITARVRWGLHTVDALRRDVELRSRVDGVTRTEVSLNLNAVTTPATHSGPAQATDPGGAAWSQASLDSLQLVLRAHPVPSGGYDFRALALYADVVYNEAPVITVTGPADDDAGVAGVQSRTSQPTITWTYADPESDAQESWSVRVYEQPAGGWAGFDPNTTTEKAVYTGAGFSSGTSVKVGTGSEPPVYLRNGIVHRAYVRATDAGSGRRWSAWAYREFTVVLDPPQTATITPTAETATARIALALQGRDNVLTRRDSSFEDSVGAEDTYSWVSAGNNAAGWPKIVADQFRHGTKSLQVSAAAAGDLHVRSGAGTGARPAVGGKQYTALASVRVNIARNARAILLWYDAAGTPLGQTDGALVACPVGVWTQVAVTANAPGTAAFAAVMVQIVAMVATESANVDQASIAPGALTTWTIGGLLSSQRVAVERSADGGVTWKAVRGASAVDLADPAQTATVYDYEAPTGVPVTYRAKTTATEQGTTVASDWSASAALTPTVTSWWLKDVVDPTRNIVVRINSSTFETRRSERQGVFAPLGRTKAVVISDVIAGESGSLELSFIDDAAFNAFEKIRSGQRALLLQSPYGHSLYVRLGAERRASVLLGGDRRTPKRVVSVDFVEVTAP